MAHHSHVISTLVTTEKQALTLSLFGCITFAIFGIGYGLFGGSNAIMLDGIFTLFSMGMTGLGLVTAYLVTRPSDARFQYGYAHFEPITNVINGTIILLLCLGALYSGITTLLDGGREIDLGHALIYAAVSTFFCAIIYRIEAQVAEQVDSELVRVDSKEWLVDTLLSATLLIGFVVAIGLDAIGYGQYNRYIDPVLVSLLALCATLIPIKVLGRNLREVLKIAPKGDVPQQVEQEIEALRQRHGIECYSHLAKSGRRFDLELNILVAPGQEWPVERQDALRQELWSRLGDTLGDAWLSVCFTREKRWL
ncbi:cation diffusion facilitator family transporter [Aeromonas veronii]|uniref:cation diffusion facilitator family transporter n=1 Tax=Aeromonas veronii TaxID=654 RepID=UPI003BA2FD47